MANLSSLLPQASVIRDATREGENTALRVGSMFVDLIQTLESMLPPEILDATGLSTSVGDSSVTISFRSVAADGTKTQRQVVIPAASQTKAGLLTPVKLKELDNAFSDLSASIASAYSSAVSLANAAQEDADAALENADTALSRISAIEKSAGQPGGLATLDGGGRVPAEQLPEIPEQRVLPFEGVHVAVGTPQIHAGSAAGPGAVVFLPATKTFVFRSGTILNAQLYANWPGAEAYGSAPDPASGRTPDPGKLYVSASNGVYIWDGRELYSVTRELTEALDTRLSGLSLRVITPEEDAAMAAEGTHDPDTLYFIPEEE